VDVLTAPLGCVTFLKIVIRETPNELTAFMPHELDGALRHLQDILVGLPPAGPSGFEGLIATALSSFTGQVFRLAKSGLQYGRDASSAPARFAVAMEAKRYSANLTTEDLIGKASVAGGALRNLVDIWVLGATSEVGEGTIVTLSELLQEFGITFLPLDWAERPLPPLAVLLASTRSATVSWFATHVSAIDQTTLASDLDTVVSAAAFDAQRRALFASLSEAEVGLGPLRDQTRAWLQERFTTRLKSQQSFSQFLTVSDADRPALQRPAITTAIDDAVNSALTAESVIALVGEEGVGKSWAAAQWWATLTDPPIALFVAGRRASLLLPHDPIESIARILADTHGGTSRQAWRKRIGRWGNAPDRFQLRFVLILDGLNEHSTLPWADVIKSHRALLYQLGGVLIVSSRSAHWVREVEPRLRGLVDVHRVDVPPFSDEELASELNGIGVPLAELPAKVREFVRNPRVCSIAKSMLSQLIIHPEQLSIEKLLLEYWKARVVERGDLVAHNEGDFENLIRAHARAWLAEPKAKFDRDQWTEFSGAARRKGLDVVRDDLTEVEEGRFLHTASPTGTKYEFREEVLPYAIGLLINSELHQQVDVSAVSTDKDADEALSGIIDPIRGFDRVAEIVAAAVILANWSSDTSHVISRALIRAWCSLQNVGGAAFETMRQAATINPIPFLDLAEQAEGDLPPGYQPQTLIKLIRSVSDHGNVAVMLQTRLPRWLGLWSRKEGLVLRRPENPATRSTEVAARIDRKLSELMPEERVLFDRLTFETAAPPEMRLAHLCALLLVGKPLAMYAEALLGWSFAQSVAFSVYNASEELNWVVKLNRKDPAEAVAAVNAAISSITSESSEIARRAAASALWLFGDEQSEKRTHQLYNPTPGKSWHVRERFSDVDPRDPGALSLSDLQTALDALAAVDTTTVWSHMGTTLEEHNLEYAIPPLARFNADPLVGLLRRIAASVRQRTGFSLRQLAWRLVGLSPLFTQETVMAVLEAFDRLVATDDDESTELNWVASNLLVACMPHLDPRSQLQWILRLPPSYPLDPRFRYAISDIPGEVIDEQLARVTSLSDDVVLSRVLLFSALGHARLTETLRTAILENLDSTNEQLAIAAAIAGMDCADAKLFDQILALPDVPAHRSYYHRVLFARAVIAAKRVDLVGRVHSSFLGQVVSNLEGKGLELYAAYLEYVITKALSSRSVVLGDEVQPHVDVSTDGFNVKRWGEATEVQSAEDALRELSQPDGVLSSFAKKQEGIRGWLLQFNDLLENKGAEYLSDAPPQHGLECIVAEHTEKVSEWLKSILCTTDPWLLRQVKNVGLAVAAAFGSRDDELSAAVLSHLRGTRSITRVTIDGHDFDDLALFRARGGAAINRLRSARFTSALADNEIESAVAAAEFSGAGEWLEHFVEELLSSEAVADHALAITIAGLRCENAQSERVLQATRIGFLADVSTAALKHYKQNAWAMHWMSEVATAQEPTDWWRFAVLAESAIDRRYSIWFAKPGANALWQRFGNELLDRLRRKAEEQTEERNGTLFGHKVPDSELRAVLDAQ
jgi:hypothetical protein